jgi:S1-C subfamily serine protease
MRYPVLCTLALAVVALPIAGQAQVERKLSVVTGDTTITIERGSRNNCVVIVGSRTLSDDDASPICARQSRMVTWQFSSVPMVTDTLFTRLPLALRSMESQPALRLFDRFDSMSTRRAVLGITVDTRARDTDRYGAYVAGVTPSGPADKAGLQSGDILTGIGGTSLASGATKQAVGADESRPYVRLIERMDQVEVGKPIRVEYRRGDANRTVQITPQTEDRLFALAFATPTRSSYDSTARGFFSVAPGAPRDFALALTPNMVDGVPVRGFSGVLGNTELAPMNPKLGRYFGVDRGVLIVDTDGSNSLGLEPGDVVRSIDGRDIRNPGELGRVLRSYTSGDQITIGITRDQKQQTLNPHLP